MLALVNDDVLDVQTLAWAWVCASLRECVTTKWRTILLNDSQNNQPAEPPFNPSHPPPLSPPTTPSRLRPSSKCRTGAQKTVNRSAVEIRWQRELWLAQWSAHLSEKHGWVWELGTRHAHTHIYKKIKEQLLSVRRTTNNKFKRSQWHKEISSGGGRQILVN